MKASDLEKASDAVTEVERVNKFLQGMLEWKGPISVSFGGYEFDIRSAAGRNAIVDIAKSERHALLCELNEYGVDINE